MILFGSLIALLSLPSWSYMDWDGYAKIFHYNWVSVNLYSHFEEFMLNIFQCYVLWPIKVHGANYDFIIDHNFYQYQTALSALFNTICLEFYTVFHSTFLFLLAPIFLIYLFCRSHRAWGKWHFGGMDGTEFFISYFAPSPSLWQYKYGMEAGMSGKLPALTQRP